MARGDRLRAAPPMAASSARPRARKSLEERKLWLHIQERRGVSRRLLRELHTRDIASSFRAKDLLMDTLGFRLLNARARGIPPPVACLPLLSKRIGGLAFFLIILSTFRH